MTEPAHDLDSLAALVEGRLDVEERQRAMAHLAQCAQCRNVAAELGRAMADGSLKDSRRRNVFPSSVSARLWLPIAASVLVGTFAWFQFASSSYSPRPTQPVVPEAQSGIDSEDDLLRRRSAGRKVGDKTFRMSGGEWVDSTFAPSPGLPTVVIRGAQERSDWLARIPQLAPYAALGDRVIVTWQGTVYRFEQ